ncbi:DNA polymerase III subunit alpha [Cohaesibacter haloalkalitolerans]|uniref:DNA polymerase III subunit alpha n=1 Tax=Cohaesibacter haloalkalitolerans TaxID=1162980 RepID=UPI000E653B79|nr:DNA polymerase III subunit alpha [Cohaesibacter haloalkalitolerans]
MDGLSDTLKFIHLHVHSAYSLLEGAMPVAKIIKKTKSLHMPAVAITDTRNMFGALEFSEKAVSEGIQPIMACQVELNCQDGDFQGAGHTQLPSLVLLAATDEGWANMKLLVSRSYLAPEDDREPHVSISDLEELGAGIICLTGGSNGPVDRMLASNHAPKARDRLAALKTIFGDRLYVEIMRQGMASEVAVEPLIIDLAYEMDIPLVATNDVYFSEKEDFEAHDALLAIAESKVLIQSDRRQLTRDYYLKSQEEMVELFSDLPEALENTIEIARRCSTRVRTVKPLLPRFAGADADPEEAERHEAAELRKQAEEGLRKRLDVHGLAPGLTEESYWERLEFELGIIVSMKFPGYFLIVADFIKWAKEHGIPVGPGRGSGAGSLVAWSLTITDLDPLRFALLFERFLNPERVSMPDFDIDFCQDRREEVVHYVQRKYGWSNVGQIITYGTLQARMVLRDVGRVLQMPFGQVDKLCKLVPMKGAVSVSLPEALEQEPRLVEARKEEEIVDRLISISLKLEGLYRHTSTHAAGVVIGDRSLDKLVPMYRDPRSDMPVTQFNMKWVEKTGLVKFDFLGLKTLTVLQTAVRFVAQRGIELNLSEIPIDDPKSYEILCKGETVGVFQLESMGMRKALLDMKPDQFEDIIAIVALYRPGPMANIPVYCARKRGEEKPDYMHDLLEPVLKETYGIIIYQEQVMQIAQILSGYTLGQADMLRRAMGKKIREEMEKQRVFFCDGAEERGVAREQASEIYDLVAKFADYGFNKSHAAAYALVAYQTAYMKANYPVEFLAAIMTLDMNNTDKLSEFRRDAIRLGIEVRPPSINESGVEFVVKDGSIIYSMAAIKGVGQPAAEHIMDVRGDKPFKDLADFAKRISPRVINKRTIENLAAAGTFDVLNPNRAQVVASIDVIMGEATSHTRDASSGQGGLFGEQEAAPLPLPDVRPWTSEQKLQREYSAIGFYLSAHPLDEYVPQLEKMRIQLWQPFELAVKQGASAGRLAGTITARQERKTKTGNRMGIITVSDPTGQYEAVLFSEALARFRDMLEPGKTVILEVGADERPEGISVRINNVRPLESDGMQKVMRVFVNDPKPLSSLQKQLDDRGDGEVSVIVMLDEGQCEVEMRLKGKYYVSPEVGRALKAIPGVVDVEVGAA